MARLSHRQSRAADNLVRILLAAVNPDSTVGCDILRPLWAEEGLHRAYSLVRLAGARPHAGEHFHLVPAVREAMALDLADQFRSLETEDEDRIVPASRILRHVVADLCVLFGIDDNIALETDIEWVELRGYQRRALVLAATELVINALLHGFPGRTGGRIVVSMTSHGFGRACLRVADDGVGLVAGRPNLDNGIAAALADLLEADLTYNRIDGWTTAAIMFPARGLDDRCAGSERSFRHGANGARHSAAAQ